jgi:hypothetical protein
MALEFQRSHHLKHYLGAIVLSALPAPLAQVNVNVRTRNGSESGPNPHSSISNRSGNRGSWRVLKCPLAIVSAGSACLSGFEDIF